MFRIDIALKRFSYCELLRDPTFDQNYFRLYPLLLQNIPNPVPAFDLVFLLQIIRRKPLSRIQLL